MAGKYLTEEEVQILKHEFEQYDTDGGGNITVEEFGRVMQASGQKPSEEELAQIIREVDLDGDGTISFDEFIAMMTGRARAPHIQVSAPSESDDDAQEARLEAAWKSVEPSLEGSLSAAQLRQVMEGLGDEVSEAEVQVAMGSVGESGKEGRISYKEFVQFAKRRQTDDLVGAS